MIIAQNRKIFIFYFESQRFNIIDYYGFRSGTKYLFLQAFDPAFEFLILLHLCDYDVVAHGNGRAGNIAEILPQCMPAQAREISP